MLWTFSPDNKNYVRNMKVTLFQNIGVDNGDIDNGYHCKCTLDLYVTILSLINNNAGKLIRYFRCPSHILPCVTQIVSHMELVLDSLF